ncbi:MAG: hypothetical protein KatS3mg005_3877 [Bryobacteraceae bacterium]|nr:MAG: hypothetical protein KatS3mg005_3877 [Bryobacteraceae bacterium]
MNFLSQVRSALKKVDPSSIRALAAKRYRILVVAGSSSSYAAVEDFLTPAGLSRQKRLEAAETLVRACDPDAEGKFHFIFAERGTAAPEGWIPGEDLFFFDVRRLPEFVGQFVAARPEESLALARLLEPVRHEYARQTIHQVARENALFSILTSLPNVVPGLAQIPWLLGEFASDTAVLTANQIRMAFLLAAASDREVGFSEQRREIGSIVAGAWGWRAGARQLVSKIPFGGGIIPKAAVAYAGTYVVGLALDRLYRLGYGLSREEREKAYEEAYARGRQVASNLVRMVKAG